MDVPGYGKVAGIHAAPGDDEVDILHDLNVALPEGAHANRRYRFAGSGLQSRWGFCFGVSHLIHHK